MYDEGAKLVGTDTAASAARTFPAATSNRIQCAAPDKSLGVANRDLAAIESVRPDSRISALLDNGRQVDFDPKEHHHFDHGNAVTSHSSQGLTA